MGPPRGPFAPSGEAQTPRRLQFSTGSRKGSDGSGSSGGYPAGRFASGGTGFCDPEAFSDTGSVRSMRSARSSPNLGGWPAGSGSPACKQGMASMETTLESPLEEPVSKWNSRTPRSATPRSASDYSEPARSSTPRGSTPRGSLKSKSNAFERNMTVGNLEGYHGVRVERHATNKRLFGLGPQQRSAVDEVVYGRDMDFSMEKETNAEIDVLINMFEGAAGRKSAIAEVLEDVPGCGVRGPDDDQRLCMRSAERILEAGFEGCAGQKTREPRDMKRAWRRLPMQRSNVAEIVFGQNQGHISGHEQLFLSQFSRTAGFSARIKKDRESGVAAQVEFRKEGRPFQRRFYMNNTISESTGLHQPMEHTVKAQKQIQEAGTFHDLTDAFHGAAGKSSRFKHDVAGRATRRDEPHPLYCVYA